MTLAELLAEVDRLGEAATKGPWRACKDEDDVPVVCVPPDHAGPVAWNPNPYSPERRACLFLTEADAALIAFARTALPRLARVAEAAVEMREEYVGIEDGLPWLMRQKLAAFDAAASGEGK